MARGIRPFSQRDRVPFHTIPIGTPFLWRGARWSRVSAIAAIDSRGRGAMPPPHVKVHVTRTSGIAGRLAYGPRG